MNLKWLIAPVEPVVFINEYLEQKPVVIKRNDARYFESLLRIQDIDLILERGLASGKIDVTMQSAGKKIHAAEYMNSQNTRNVNVRTGFDPKKILNLFYQEKATLLINSGAQEWEPLRALMNAINFDLNTRSGVNIFLTPPYAQCFQAHFDEHDLFIIQIAGKKRWKIYENAFYLPDQPQNGEAFDFSKLKLLYDIEIEAGDLVYFPRGFVHEVVTTDSLSAHVTLGCMNVTWNTIIADFVRGLGEQEAMFREAFIKEAMSGQINQDAIREQLANRFEKDFTLANLDELAKAYKVKPLHKFEFNFQEGNLAVNNGDYNSAVIE